MKGHSGQKKLDNQSYATISPIGSGKFATDVAPRALYEVAPEYTITSSDSGKREVDGQKKTYQSITITGITNVKVGDIVRFTSTSFENIELSVIDVDGETLYLSDTLGVDVTGETFLHMRYITLTIDSQGNLSVAAGPIQFVKDSVDTEVNEDTVDPTNNSGLPTKAFVTIDGVEYPLNIDTADSSNNVAIPAGMYMLRDGNLEIVERDTVTPANTKPIPVELVDISGVPANLNITTGDLGVEISHDGVTHTWDSTRIGDGVTLARIRPDAGDVGFGELEVVDPDLNTATGTVSDVKEIDPDVDATVIQILKGQVQKIIDVESQLITSNVKSDTTESYYKRDFSASPLTTASGFVSLRVLTSSINKINITNNSGNEFLIRNSTSGKEIIVGQGVVFSQALVGVATDVIEISALGSDAIDGIIYINFEG